MGLALGRWVQELNLKSYELVPVVDRRAKLGNQGQVPGGNSAPDNVSGEMALGARSVDQLGEILS